MTLLEELRIFVKNILHWVYYFIGFSLFFFIFGLRKIVFSGKNYFLPIPSENSFSVQVFKIVQRYFMPSGVQIIATNPMSGFVAQLEVSLIMAFLITSPIFLYSMIRYISPALLEHEKKAIWKSVAVSTVLFGLGCLFAYYYMIPLTFKFMYPFTTALGVTPFFSLDAFMSWVISIILVTGLVFLLPIFMLILSFLKIISPEIWKKKWRHAFIFLLIFCAIITPDQTGITMILLFIPLMVLYAFGAFLAARYKRDE
ncbi:MAG: twin-arginine translocase subunit TatC [Minisyncoccia bacterium]